MIADRLASGVAKIGETLPGAAIRLLKRLELGSVVAPEMSESSPSADLSGMCWPVGGTLVAWNDVLRVATDAVSDPYGLGLRLDRAPFDAALRLAAVSAGACFQPANVAGLECQAQGWHVQLDDGRVLGACWLVDATGRRARVARLIGQRRCRSLPLVALYRRGRPQINGDLNRTIITAMPDGWCYAGRLGDGRWALGYHTTPRQAAWLHAEPSRWEGLIAASAGLSELFGRFSLDPVVHAHDVRSAWLDRSIGERWIACGDAALAFDPIAGQGLFNALYTGMSAAQTICARRDGAVSSGYAEELARVATLYTQRRRSLYQQERRWCDRPFWQMHRQ